MDSVTRLLATYGIDLDHLSSLVIKSRSQTVFGLEYSTAAALMIAFNPIYWNSVAQLEYRTHSLSKAVGPYAGCYLLAISIFALGLVRDHLFHEALRYAPVSAGLIKTIPIHRELGALLFFAGNALVLPSMFALGITGTYLGDYFGILMDARVTSYPFNVTDNPMYWGSTLAFLGTALYYAKPLGFALTAEVFVMYVLALRFEEPYTAAIYAAKDKKKRIAPKSRSSPRKVTPAAAIAPSPATDDDAASDLPSTTTRRSARATRAATPTSTEHLLKSDGESDSSAPIRRSPRKHK
ncbi:Serine/threonine kinase [Savitreella phatthalungensis]